MKVTITEPMLNWLGYAYEEEGRGSFASIMDMTIGKALIRRGWLEPHDHHWQASPTLMAIGAPFGPQVSKVFRLTDKGRPLGEIGARMRKWSGWERPDREPYLVEARNLILESA